MSEQLERLKNRVYVTKNARFEAYRRIKRRKLSSTVSLALLSFSIIGFNIVQLCTGYEAYNEAITAVTIMLSVFVLVLSLLVSYNNYSEREHKFYECALQLSTLYDDLTMAPDNPEIRLVKYYHKEYDRILLQCGVNHINIDYQRARSRIEKYKEEYDDCELSGLWLEWNILDINFLYWILAFGIPVVAGLLIFKYNFLVPSVCTCG